MVNKLDYFKKGADLFCVVKLEDGVATLQRMKDFGKKKPGRLVNVSVEKLEAEYKPMNLPTVTITERDLEPVEEPEAEAVQEEPETVNGVELNFDELEMLMVGKHLSELEEETARFLQMEILEERRLNKELADQLNDTQLENANLREDIKAIRKMKDQAVDELESMQEVIQQVWIMAENIDRLADAVKNTTAIIDNIVGSLV